VKGLNTQFQVKWTEAKEFCEERSLKLAVMNSKFETEALFDAAPHLRGKLNPFVYQINFYKTASCTFRRILAGRH
jgi:hypothetical protein